MHVNRPPLLHSLEERKLEYKSQCLKLHGYTCRCAFCTVYQTLSVWVVGWMGGWVDGWLGGWVG